MDAFFERTQSVIGSNGVKALQGATVAVIGLGGVGSFLAEALARCGVGRLILIDGDRVTESNVNRQLYALRSTVGRYKSEVAKNRIADINPAAAVSAYSEFVSADNIDNFCLEECDYIADAIDSVLVKTEIIAFAKAHNIPIISCMGTGNKLCPEQLCVADISKTTVCPLARSVRHALKQKGITKGVKTVFSTEQPIKNDDGHIGSISFVPSSAGLLMASVIIRELI
ncbi:MAG: tRNA threonylcarbamoyladenosine dehydratase [Clostridia bacterium]|nr:tRNA threonylcarbamoyladenosine dehydratase [Clostridia bacterium]